jgi:hypothetical protein
MTKGPLFLRSQDIDAGPSDIDEVAACLALPHVTAARAATIVEALRAVLASHVELVAVCRQALEADRDGTGPLTPAVRHQMIVALIKAAV